MHKKLKSAFGKILIRIFQAPIHIYRIMISPWLGSNCRFEPSCSSYALQALEKHGVIKGIGLSLKRLGKCHPYCKKTGYDPVP